MNRAEKRRQQKLAKKNQSTRAQQKSFVNPDVALQNGILAHQSGQLDAAIRWYRVAIKAQPKSADALNNLGIALQSQGQFEEAVACLQKVVFINPQNSVACYNLGNAQKQIGSLSEAVQNYKKAISLNPQYQEALTNLGNALKEQEEFDEAIACFSQALTINPNTPITLNDLGAVLKEQGKLDEAIVILQKAIALLPEFAEAYCNLGLALHKQGNVNEAIASYQTAISIRPEFAEAYFNIGVVLLEQGELQHAVANFGKALSLNSSFADAYCNYSIALLELGKPDQAVANFYKAILVKPDSLDSISNLQFALESISYAAITKFYGDPIKGQRSTELPLPSADYFIALQTKFSKAVEQKLIAAIPLEFSIINYRVKKVIAEETLEGYEKVVDNLAKISQETVVNDSRESAPAIIGVGQNKTMSMVAMLGTANAASGLFHSMLDNHPEISIFPGVYMSGYFGRRVWERITSRGFKGSARQFARLYAVLFDSHSKCKPPPHHIGDDYGAINGIGVDEGFDKLGVNHDTPLAIDRGVFLQNLEHILDNQS